MITLLLKTTVSVEASRDKEMGASASLCDCSAGREASEKGQLALTSLEQVDSRSVRTSGVRSPLKAIPSRDTYTYIVSSFIPEHEAAAVCAQADATSLLSQGAVPDGASARGDVEPPDDRSFCAVQTYQSVAALAQPQCGSVDSRGSQPFVRSPSAVARAGVTTRIDTFESPVRFEKDRFGSSFTERGKAARAPAREGSVKEQLKGVLSVHQAQRDAATTRKQQQEGQNRRQGSFKQAGSFRIPRPMSENENRQSTHAMLHRSMSRIM